MAPQFLVSVFLGIAFLASPTISVASSKATTTIGIRVIIPEHAKNQQYSVGYEHSFNKQFTALSNPGCQYNSQQLLKTAYQQSLHRTKSDNQGFITVVITAP